MNSFPAVRSEKRPRFRGPIKTGFSRHRVKCRKPTGLDRSRSTPFLPPLVGGALAVLAIVETVVFNRPPALGHPIDGLRTIKPAGVFSRSAMGPNKEVESHRVLSDVGRPA